MRGVSARRVGRPRLHLRTVDSTNARAKELAAAGAPHGTIVTARSQTSGRGRQGRAWSSPAGRALIVSVVVRPPGRLLPLAGAVAVAEVAESAGLEATVKWPNDVLVRDLRKLAGVLAEGRPQEGWGVLGIGLNVAVRPSDLPEDVRERAGSLGLEPDALEPTLERLLEALTAWLEADDEAVLAAARSRDALLGREVSWSDGTGVGRGLDASGALVVELPSGERVALDAGEVHLGRGTR